MQKKSLTVNSPDTVNVRVLSADWPHPFLTMATKTFDQLLNFVNLC